MVLEWDKRRRLHIKHFLSILSFLEKNIQWHIIKKTSLLYVWHCEMIAVLISLLLGIPIIRFISIHTSGQCRHYSIIQAVFMVRLCATCKQSVKVLITIQEKRVKTHVQWIISICKLGCMVSHPLVIHTAGETSGSNNTLLIWNEHINIYYACKRYWIFVI